MRKSIIVVLTVFLVSIPAAGVAAFAGGDGSPATPYKITNCDQLQEVTNNLSANYVLANDVDCSDTVNWNFEEGAFRGFAPIGWEFNGEPPFIGTFDGQGHKITDLFINGPMAPAPWNAPHYVGLFGLALKSAIIKNVYAIFRNLYAPL